MRGYKRFTRSGGGGRDGAGGRAAHPAQESKRIEPAQRREQDRVGAQRMQGQRRRQRHAGANPEGRASPGEGSHASARLEGGRGGLSSAACGRLFYKLRRRNG